MLKNEAISGFLRERIDAGDFPSAVYLVAETGKIVFQDALGLAVVDSERIEATPATIYDLASLTKPLVTGLLAAMLIESGDLRPDAPIAEYTGGSGDWHRRVTIRDLLTHTSGMPAWRPFYLIAERPQDVAKLILDTEAEPQPAQVTYSDLNFILLAKIVEGRAGEKLDRIAQYRIFETLQLRNTSFRPGSDRLDRIAASEKGNEYERQTCIEQGFLDPKDAVAMSSFRDKAIRGEVHDGNAYFMGGVAGHAGLFSTAAEVFKIALQFLPEHTTLLKPETCELFRTNFTQGLNEDRSFAFQLASTADSTAGPLMPPESFGHNGFTGTSLWIDPNHDRIFILLTNRTHAHPLPFVNINSTRRRFHDLAITELAKFN